MLLKLNPQTEEKLTLKDQELKEEVEEVVQKIGQKLKPRLFWISYKRYCHVDHTNERSCLSIIQCRV